MVYCTKCGTKNEEDAAVCAKCGARLEVSMEKRFERRAEEWGEQFGKRAEEGCFGLPHGGAIVGLIIGIVIILAGISWLLSEVYEIEFEIWPITGIIIAIIFGILIVAGALYSFSRR